MGAFNWLFDLMDVVAAVRATTGWARGLRNIEARVALLGMLIVDAGLGWLTWHFDIETTLQFARGIHEVVLGQLAEGALVYAPIILIIITIFPTAIRQTLAGSADKLKALAAAIVLLNLFDMRTDWPRVQELFDKPALWEFFSFARIGDMQIFQYITWGAARFFFLLLATDVFEVLFVASLAATVILLVNSFAGRAVTGATTRISP